MREKGWGVVTLSDFSCRVTAGGAGVFLNVEGAAACVWVFISVWLGLRLMVILFWIREFQSRPNTMAAIGLGCLWYRREGLHTAASAEGV